MPSNLPSSFASAAAGQNANRDARGGRGDGRGAGGDWSRRDGRSANGTLTLRRSSTTPIGHGSQPVPSTDLPVQQPSAVDISAQQLSNYESGPARYTKEDLLGVFRLQKGSPDDPNRLFISGWDPSHANGGNVRGWGKPNDNHVPQEPGACWDQNGDTTPMGLQGLSAEEKDAFSTEINSPLKPPTQNKEGHQGNVNGRKASLSHGSGNTYGVISPSSATRPGTRRRETTEASPFGGGLASPTTGGRFSREDSSPWTQRRGNDLRESEPDDGDAEQSGREPQNKLPFGNLMRSNTTGTASMSSLWPPSNQTTPGGGFGNFAMPSSSAVGDKRAGASGGAGGSGGGSRLAHLIPKDNQESVASKAGDSQTPQQSWRSRPRTDTDPFGEDELSGSAVLGGAQDTSSAGQSHASRVGILGTPVKGSTGDFGMSGLNLGSQSGDNGPNSPSETNPYRSPAADRHDNDDAETGATDQSHGLGHTDPPANFGSIARGFGATAFDGSDRSQTSSVGAKPYPLGNLSGWPAPAGPSTGTPDRDRPNFGGAFGSSLFSPMGDLQSPGLSNLNSVFGPASAGLGSASIGRGSKLGSLFPPAMQAQMQTHDHDHGMNEGVQGQGHPLGAIGRGSMPGPARDTDSPMRSNRGVFEELFPSSDAARSHTAFSASDSAPPGSAVGGPQSFTPVTGGMPFGGHQGGVEASSAQVRQMVMPDRMRWVYLDPQGQVQGPFTGLEMNDWYKANFFTPDLRVKKVEDPEFEPLGQLIRRIGNSREPFLVPQIGVAHGPAPQGGPFNPNTGGGVVPPLSGVFPSFGRTLTAEEQNNLERRKQEEQYMMAQQRDYMMRQQTMPKFPVPGGPGLQHHSSAQSLQSQPSFGSMTSPIGVPAPQQPIGAAAGAAQPGSASDSQNLTQGGSRAAAGHGDPFLSEDIGGLSISERDILMSLQGGAEGAGGQEAGNRADLPDIEHLNEDQEGFRERLKEFAELRAQHEAAQAAQAGQDNDASLDAAASTVQRPAKSGKSSKKKSAVDDSLSLTQQVQQAQAAAAAATQPIETDMPMPFPPPSSSTPLPAPTAQRARSNLPEQYSRSQSGTPEAVQPPPLAPWAKDPGHEGQKGPSLKEIQEAEARKAAKAEEAAAAMRKATMEQEAASVREKEKQAAAAAAAAGLPATSTWGHGSPASATSPWIKPGATKTAASGPSAAVPSSNSKKTLAEIQREEELRKQKARDVAVQSGSPATVSKSYANLAGKPNMMPGAGVPSSAAAPVAAAGWATVGAGGKVKTPGGPPVQTRSISTSNVKAPSPAPVRPPMPKPATSTMGASNGRSDASGSAMEEFNKWVNRELARGLTSVTDIASFQNTLDVLPLESGIIADAVYANSTTMDGRHFGEEYVRRKKLAEKGIVEKQSSADAAKAAGAGGWNEVAKRSSSTQPKEAEAGPGAIQGAGFKVVPSRKKGKK